MRLQSERYVRAERKRDRALDREHFDHLNGADKTAKDLALEVRDQAKEVAATTVTRTQYESDREADSKLHEAEREAQRLKDANVANVTAIRQGQTEGRQQVFGMSEKAFRALITIGGSLLLGAELLRLFGVTL